MKSSNKKIFSIKFTQNFVYAEAPQYRMRGAHTTLGILRLGKLARRAVGAREEFDRREVRLKIRRSLAL